MTEEKMVDLDTTGEGQEVELQEEEKSTEENKVEEKVEDSSKDKKEVSSEESSSDDSKEDGLDKYSKNVQRRIKKLLDRVEKTEQREQEALRFAETAKKKKEK